MSGAGSGTGNTGHSHGMAQASHGDSFDISWRHYPPQLMFPCYPPQSPIFSNPGAMPRASQYSYQSPYSSQGVASAHMEN
jgi:hypothetical protein